MRKWAEVIQGQGEESELVATLDVTSEPDGGASVMADLKIVYPNSQYRWHTCRHDENKGCSTEVVL